MSEQQYRESCQALQCVCSSVETMLGPKKSLKCYLSSEGDSGILGDTLQVLDALMSSYRHPTHPLTTSSTSRPHSLAPPPALQLLHECCHEHHARVGCGVTTLICLAGYWAREILTLLLHQEVPLPVIFAIFKECLGKCEKLIHANLLQLPERIRPGIPKQETRSCDANRPKTRPHVESMKVTKKQERVLSFSRHFQPRSAATCRDNLCNGDADLSTSEKDGASGVDYSSITQYVSEKLARGRETAMKLALKAIVQQQRGKTQSLSFDKQVPLQYCIVGKSEEHSRVMRGVVTTLHSDMVTVHRKVDKLKIVLLEGDCSPHFKHVGLQKKAACHVTSHDLSQLHEESTTSVWLKQATSIIKKFKIDILVVGGTVWPSLWQQCISLGVVVVKEVPAVMRQALVQLCEVTPQAYLTQCSVENIGKDVSMEVLEAGWAKHNLSAATAAGKMSSPRTYCCRLYKDASDSVLHVTTAMLCGLTEYGVDSLRHQFTNCYHRLHWAMKGLTETEGSGVSSRHPPYTTSHLLCGGGQTEAACIKMLRETLNTEDTVSKPPLYFTTSWTSDRGVLKENQWRQCVYQAFANGLSTYLVRCVMNNSPDLGQFEAMSVVEAMISSGGVVGRGEEVMCMDLAKSKWLAWQKAIQLLETIFFSTKIQVSTSKSL